MHTARAWMKRASSLPVVVGVFAVMPYGSLLVTGDLVLKDSIYSDYASFQLPMREFAQDEFAAGRFPLWNPWLGCGIPLHATGQLGLCYPLLTLFLWVLGANSAIKWSLFLHMVLCYAGQYRLGRALALSPAAASISGLTAAQCGFVTGHLVMGHVAHVAAFALLPWFFWSVIGVCRDARMAGGCRFALLSAALLLVGNPQVPYYGFLFGGLWVLGSLLRGRAAEHRLRTVAVFAFATVMAILLAGVQLVPTLELVRDAVADSPRGTAEYADNYSLDGPDLYRLAIPLLKGNSMIGIPEFAPPDFYHEKVCYLGIVTWLLALAGLLSRFGSRWPWGVAGLSLLAIVIALGRTTFLFDVLGTAVPGVFLFRCPGRCLSILAIFMSLLAARGFDSLRIRQTPIADRLRYTVSGALILMAISTSVLIARELSPSEVGRWLEYADEHLKSELQASLLAHAAAAACIWWLYRPRARVAALLTAGVLIADLGYFNVRCIQFEPRRVERPPEHVLAAIGDQYRFIEGPHSPRYYSNEVPYSKLVPVAARFHLRMVGTNEGGVLPRACEELFSAIEGDSSAALPAASCRFVVTRTDQFEWTELDLPPPRIRFIPETDVSDFRRLRDSARREQQYETVRVIADEPQWMRVEIRSPVDGVLVVSDTWYPEWTCRVDGEQAHIHRVFGSFRGVQLTPGTNVVDFRYDSASFRTGWVLSLSGAAVLLLLSVLRTTRGTPLPSRR